MKEIVLFSAIFWVLATIAWYVFAVSERVRDARIQSMVKRLCQKEAIEIFQLREQLLSQEDSGLDLSEQIERLEAIAKALDVKRKQRS